MNIYNVHNKIKNLSTFKLIILSVVTIYIIQILVLPLYLIFPMDYSNVETVNNVNLDISLFEIFWTSSIKAPIIETLIFQTLIIRFTILFSKKIFKKENNTIYLISIILSSLLFGFAHFYMYESVIKVFNTFLVGVVLAYTYIIAYTSDRKATLCVMCVHSIFNLVVFIQNFVL